MLLRGGDGALLILPRLPRLQAHLALALEAADDQRPVGTLPTVKPDLDRVAHEVALADGLRARVRNHRQADIAAGVRRERVECAQRAPVKRLILLRAIFRLNGPIFAVLIARDQI